MVTVKDIAKQAGVSIGTVDRVLHDRGRVSAETKKKILQVMKELHYEPNCAGQNLAIRRKHLKYVFYHVDPVRFSFYAEVLKGARKKARELEQYGIEVIFYQLDMHTPPPSSALIPADGIVILGGKQPATDVILEYSEKHFIPIVCYNIPLPEESVLAYVGCDYIQSGRLAAGLCALTSNGKGHIGVLTEDDGKIYSFQQRLLGFRQELEQHYPLMHIAGVYPCTDYAGGVKEAAACMLAEHPSISLVYLVNPGNYSVCQTIKHHAVHSDIHVITNDLPDVQSGLLLDGTITATICQEPEKQGALPLDLLYQYTARGILPKTKMNYVDLSIQIKQSIPQ